MALNQQMICEQSKLGHVDTSRLAQAGWPIIPEGLQQRWPFGNFNREKDLPNYLPNYLKCGILSFKACSTFNISNILVFLNVSFFECVLVSTVAEASEHLGQPRAYPRGFQHLVRCVLFDNPMKSSPWIVTCLNPGPVLFILGFIPWMWWCHLNPSKISRMGLSATLNDQLSSKRKQLSEPPDCKLFIATRIAFRKWELRMKAIYDFYLLWESFKGMSFISLAIQGGYFHSPGPQFRRAQLTFWDSG